MSNKPEPISPRSEKEREDELREFEKNEREDIKQKEV
jgi:uncharacterized protein YqeY